MKYLEEIRALVTQDDYYNCRLWDGKKHKGVPILRVNGEKIYLRKHVWEAQYSLIPKGFRIAMVCENFECINPQHMVLEPINALVDVRKSAGDPDVARVFKQSSKNRSTFNKLKARLEGKQYRASDQFSYAEGSQTRSESFEDTPQ